MNGRRRIAVAMAACAAMAVLCAEARQGVAVSQMAEAEWDDTEVATNVPLPAVRSDSRVFMLRLELDATPSNNVEAAFGCDADNDGVRGGRISLIYGASTTVAMNRALPGGFIETALPIPLPKMTNGKWQITNDEAGCLVHIFPSRPPFTLRFNLGSMRGAGIAPSEATGRQTVDAVAVRRKFPTASVRRAADSPMLFTQIRQPKTDYLVVPRVSSERRRYIPIGYMPKDVIASDSLQFIPDATPLLFGVL